jgi:large subunit ribosomal protein L10
MVLTKERKEQLLVDLKALFSESGASIASDYSGLSNPELTQLRKAMKEKGIKLIVTKNTLARKVLKDLNLEIDDEILDKPVIFAFGEDEVETAKSLTAFAKVHDKLEVLGGIVQGEVADKSKVTILALLPDRGELEAKLVGILAAPTYGLVNVLHGNIRGLVSVLGQIRDQK